MDRSGGVRTDDKDTRFDKESASGPFPRIFEENHRR